MKELAEKISSYNLFNNLLPGAIFAVTLKHLFSIDILKYDTMTLFFVFYFIGMIINRLGSIIIEPLIKILRLVKFADYNKFITASQLDSKIETLSETNNIYRTIIAMAVAVIAIEPIMALSRFGYTKWLTSKYSVFCFVIFVFAFSYIKQTKYIVQRVNKATSDK